MMVKVDLLPHEVDLITKLRQKKNYSIDEQEIEEIIDDSIQEMKERETDREETKGITLTEVYNEILKLKSEIVETHGILIKFKDKVKDLTGAVTKYWKNITATSVLFLIIGYTIAVYHHANIKPFIVDIIKMILRQFNLGE